MYQQQVLSPSSDSPVERTTQTGDRFEHAVIIAAGSGMRLGKATNSRPKPLLKIGGVPIILRTLLTAHEAGIRHFIVVTGYRAEMLEDFLRRESPPDIVISCLRNDKWQLQNGLSVIEAKNSVPEPFLLLMADHLFEADIIRKLAAQPLPPDYCRLAVDYHTENVLDLADATKVKVVDGKITDIGKEIFEYNAVDTGVFLCSHAIFEALEAAASEGNESLSDGIRKLAQSGRMQATDIGSLLWQDIDTEADLKEGERKLLTTLTSRKDSWLTRHINRRISLAATSRLAHTSITPNQITLFNFSVGILSALCMLPGSYFLSLVGVSLFLLASILDGCDGEIARLKYQHSRLGAWLDITTDNITCLAFFACLTYGQVRATGSSLYFLPGGMAIIASLASFVLAILGHRRLKQWRGPIFSGSRLQDVLQTSSQEKLAVWIDRIANRDFNYLLVFLAFIERLQWFLWLAAIGAPIFALLLYRVLARDRLDQD